MGWRFNHNDFKCWSNFSLPQVTSQGTAVSSTQNSVDVDLSTAIWTEGDIPIQRRDLHLLINGYRDEVLCVPVEVSELGAPKGAYR
jgi:hypothetical protein